MTVRQLIRESPDPTVVTVYLEDTIDVLGAALALLALTLHRVTGSALPDALATIAIGLMLGFVALRLTGRNRQLLTNQAVPDRYIVELRRRLVEMPGISGVATLSAVYLGPGEVLVTAEVTVEAGQDGDGVVAALDHARTRDHPRRAGDRPHVPHARAVTARGAGDPSGTATRSRRAPGRSRAPGGSSRPSRP